MKIIVYVKETHAQAVDRADSEHIGIYFAATCEIPRQA